MPLLMELWSIIYLGGEVPLLEIVWSTGITEGLELYIESVTADKLKLFLTSIFIMNIFYINKKEYIVQYQ